MEKQAKKKYLDVLAILGFACGVPFCVFYEAWIVLPTYLETMTQLKFFLHISLTVFLFVQVYANWLILLRTDASIAAKNKSSDELGSISNASICLQCQLKVPPRSHHCKLCNVCIVRRDHHCYFSGGCIGAANYRYYLIMLLYAWLAAFYCTIFNWHFVGDILGSWFNVALCLVAPHVALLLRYVSFMQFLCGCLTSIGAVFFSLITYLLGLQLRQLLYGQTRHEMRKAIFLYDKGVPANLRDIFGERYFSVFINPFTTSSVRILDHCEHFKEN